MPRFPDHCQAVPPLSARDALLRQAAAQTGDVSDGTWKAALKAGWTDTELVDPA